MHTNSLLSLTLPTELLARLKNIKNIKGSSLAIAGSSCEENTGSKEKKTDIKDINLNILKEWFEECNELINADNEANNENNKSYLARIFGNKKLSDQEKADIESFKAHILQALLNHLKALIPVQSSTPAAPAEQQQKSEKNFTKFLRYTKYIGTAIISFLIMGIYSLDGFLGIENVLTTFFSLPHVPLLAISLAVTGINLILITSFEGSFLQKLFGVSINLSPLKSAMDAQVEQINTSTLINTCFRDVGLKDEYRKSCYEFVESVNEDLYGKYSDSSDSIAKQEYLEHPVKKIARYGITLFGAAMAGIGGYFLGTLFLGMIGLSLTGPVGWGIIGGIIVISIVGYLAMQAPALYKMFNPAAKSFEKINEAGEDFVNHSYQNKAEIQHLASLQSSPPQTETQTMNHTIHCEVAAPSSSPAPSDELPQFSTSTPNNKKRRFNEVEYVPTHQVFSNPLTFCSNRNTIFNPANKKTPIGDQTSFSPVPARRRSYSV